jgi:hypothetical protein
MGILFGISIVVGVLNVSACEGGSTDPQRGRTAPGSSETRRTATLEAAANLIQSKGPIGKVSQYHVDEGDNIWR